MRPTSYILNFLCLAIGLSSLHSDPATPEWWDSVECKLARKDSWYDSEEAAPKPPEEKVASARFKIKLYTQLIDLHSKEPARCAEGRIMLAELYEELGDESRALYHWGRIWTDYPEENFPAYSRVRKQAADTALKILGGEGAPFEQAFWNEKWIKTLGAESSSGELAKRLLRLAEAKTNLLETAEALVFFNQAEEKAKGDKALSAEIIFAKAWALNFEGQTAQATRIVSDLLGTMQDWSSEWYQARNVLNALGAAQGSRAIPPESLEHSDRYQEAHRLTESGRNDRALKEFLRVIEDYPYAAARMDYRHLQGLTSATLDRISHLPDTLREDYQHWVSSRMRRVIRNAHQDRHIVPLARAIRYFGEYEGTDPIRKALASLLLEQGRTTIARDAWPPLSELLPQTPRLPDSQTPRLPDSQTPTLFESRVIDIAVNALTSEDVLRSRDAGHTFYPMLGRSAGSTLFFHNLTETFAVDTNSGKLLWNYGPQRKTQEVPMKLRSGHGKVYEGPDLFETASDERTVLCRQGYVAPSDEGLAYCLRAYDAPTGRLLWSTEMDTDDSTFIASEAELVDGIAFYHEAQMEEPLGVFVVAREARSGKVLWRSLLGSGMGQFRSDWWLRVDPRSKSAPPTYHRGLIYSVTNFGFIAVLDALTGDLLWMYEYDREDSGSSTQSSSYIAVQCRAPLVAGKHLVFRPRDASKIFCIDIEKKTLKWQLPIPRSAHLVGLHVGSVLISDEYVHSFSLENCSLQWKSVEPVRAVGRVLLAGETLLVPTAKELVEVTAGSGSVKARYGWSKSGNLAFCPRVKESSLVRFSLDSVDWLGLGATDQPATEPKLAGTTAQPVINDKPFQEPFGILWNEERNQARLLDVGSDLSTVYYTAEGKLFCEAAGLRRQSLWQVPLRSEIYISRAIGNRLYLVTRSDLRCLDALKGTDLWRCRIPDMGDAAERKVAFTKDHIAFLHQSEHSSVTLLNAATGENIWHATQSDHRFTEVHILEDSVGVVGQSGSKAVQWFPFRLTDGKLGMPIVLERAVKDVMVVTNGERLIAVPLVGGVARCTDIKDGEELWAAEIAVAPKDRQVRLRLTDDYLIVEAPYDSKQKIGLTVIEIENGQGIFRAPGGQSILKGDLLYRLSEGNIRATEYGMESDAWDAYLDDLGSGAQLLWAGNQLLILSSRGSRPKNYRTHDLMHVVALKGATSVKPFLLPGEGFTGARFSGGVLYVTTSRAIYCLAPTSASSTEYPIQSIVSEQQYDATTMGSLAQMDGLLNEWRDTESIELKGETVQAKVFLRWDQANVYLAAEVEDELHANTQGRQMLWRGDSLEIGIDSLLNDRTTNDNTFDDFRLILGLGLKGPEMFSEPENAARELKFAIKRTPLGKTIYEITLPWKLLRRDYLLRPGPQTRMGFDVAINNLKKDGTVETITWTPGLTGMADSKQFGTVRFQELRPELLAEYRALIDAVPDAPESWGLLQQILATYKGMTSNRQWVTEYEAFVRKHPTSSHVSKALTELERLYSAAELRNPRETCDLLILSAGVSEKEAGEFRGQEKFVQWVYLEPENAVYEIMIEFKTKEGWTHRAYWGQDILPFGNPGTNSRRYAGPLPKAGNWHKLELPLNVVGLEDETLIGIAFNTWGGKVIFDSTTLVTPKGEKVLIDDELPRGFGPIESSWQKRWKPWKWFRAPVHSGGMSHSSMPTKKEPHYYYAMEAVAEGRSLYEPERSQSAEGAAGSIEIYRKAVAAMPGSNQGWSFFQKILDVYRARKDQPGLRKELEAFIRLHPNCGNTSVALSELKKEVDASGGDGQFIAEELIPQARVSLTESLKFYSPMAKPWLSWSVIGPFENSGGRKMKLELEVEKKLDAVARYLRSGKPAPEVAEDKAEVKKGEMGNQNKPVEWQGITAPQDGVIDLAKLVSTAEEAIGYALARVESPAAMNAALFIGAEEIATIYVNGEKIASEIGGGAFKDANTVPIKLSKGENTVLIKLGTQGRGWRFIARFGHPDGRPMELNSWEKR